MKGKGKGGQKRKAEVLEEGKHGSGTAKGGESEKPMSKRQIKRIRKAKMQAAKGAEQDIDAGAENGSEQAAETESNEEEPNGTT